MLVGWDAKRLFLNHTGLGVYSRNLLLGFQSKCSDIRLLLFTPKSTPSQGIEIKIVNEQIVAPKGLLKTVGGLWRSVLLGKRISKEKTNIYHGLSGELPYGIDRNVKKVVTIHDLLFIRYPHDYSIWDRWVHIMKSKRACRIADAIIAVSESTRRDLIDYYGVDSAKIHLIPVSYRYEATHDTAKIKEPYILCVGSMMARKNQKILIESYSKWPYRNQYKLVIVANRKGKYYQEVAQMISDHKLDNRIIWLSSISDSDISNLYQYAQFSVYPSLYEGFGIPVLESIAHGCPIVCSRFDSALEISNDLPIYFSPLDSFDLIQKMNSAIENRETIILKINQAKSQLLERYDIENLAQQIKNLYQSL